MIVKLETVSFSRFKKREQQWHFCILNILPKAPNPMGCVNDLGISSSYNELLYLVLYVCVNEDPVVFKAYFICDSCVNLLHKFVYSNSKNPV